ncbi:hypothetical protein GY264_003561 [Salmonella enterica]|uniref:Uncharacterized protein n=1 Tax=Salmonella muenchen TaxID=596 RepID=A0A4Z9MUI4_SALMU|nr:hypothetical protein [Salmonella enterica]EAW2200537.1 hypothetical protein [Salmonella enterica subsp. enterica]EAZ6767449.1 hypothetical protein [Salmonella enterica subsp. enterica serovar Muenchen]EAB4975770.1 hypothetical protein [Salmonella enterica]EAN6517617.1 hypothetical protein [Salmonella enterica]
MARTGGNHSTPSVCTIPQNPDVKKPTGEVGFSTAPVLSWWLWPEILSTTNASTIPQNPDVKKPTGEVGFFTVPVLSWCSDRRKSLYN